MEEETREAEEKLNVRHELVRLDEIRLLEKNARFMNHETYQRLVQNIKRDGCLTSAPFLWRSALDGGKWVCVSGNHRVQAARDAGLDEITAIVSNDAISPGRRVAIQLAHNSITGEDDPHILAELYKAIEEVDWKVYSFLDDAQLDLLPEVGSLDSLSEAQLDMRTVTMAFLPEEVEHLKKSLDELNDVAQGEVFAAFRSRYEPLLEVLDDVRTITAMTNTAVAFNMLVDVAVENRKALRSEWYAEDENGEAVPFARTVDGWIPITQVFGRSAIPPDLAQRLVNLINKKVRKGEIEKDREWTILSELL
jgi:hypothetical protein